MLNRTKVCLLAIVLIGLGLRVLWIDQQSYSIDEANELNIVHHTVSEVLWFPDRLPPAYSLILKGVLAITQTDTSARWLSVGFGVLSIVCVWGVGRELLDEESGLAAALVTACLPLHILYSQYVRVYSLTFLCAAAGLWLLLLAIRTRAARYWLGFAAICLVGIYSHYFFGAFIVTSAAVLATMRRSVMIGRDALVTLCGIGICSLPLYWFLQSDYEIQHTATKVTKLDFASAAYTYLTFFTGYSLGPSRPELHTLPLSQAIKSVVPWALAIGACLGILGWEGLRPLRERRLLALMLVLLIMPVVQIGLLCQASDTAYHLRYVVWCMIPVAIWLGAGIAHGWRTWRIRVASVGLLFIAACAVWNHNQNLRYQTEDLRGAVAELVDKSSGNEPVFVISDYMSMGVDYYLPGEQSCIELPRFEGNRKAVYDGDSLREAEETIAHHTKDRGYWLIYSRPFHGDPQGLLLERLLESKSIELENEFAGVELYRSMRSIKVDE